MLRLLRGQDEKAHDELVARAFTNNEAYEDDTAVFEGIYETLLRTLEQNGKH